MHALPQRDHDRRPGQFPEPTPPSPSIFMTTKMTFRKAHNLVKKRNETLSKAIIDSDILLYNQHEEIILMGTTIFNVLFIVTLSLGWCYAKMASRNQDKS